jgi:hypothetical protein
METRKICKKCDLELHSSLFGKQKRNGRIYLNSYCRDCNREIQTAIRRSKGILPKSAYCTIPIIPESRICSRCKIDKPKSEYYTSTSKGKTRLMYMCKECSKERVLEINRQNGVLPMGCRPVEQLPTSKQCTKCKKDKQQQEFRIRHQKGKTGTTYYLNPSCLECDRQYGRDKHKRDRATEDGRNKHNNWAKQRYHRRRDEMVQKAKEYRESEMGRETRKSYIKKNKNKIYEQETVCKKKYHEKHRDGITDRYAINQLRGQGYKGEEISAELIEIKKAEIQIHRLKLKINEKPIGTKKKCTSCGENKDLSNFWRKEAYSDERCAQCASCMSFKNKKYKYKKYVEQHNHPAPTPV